MQQRKMAREQVAPPCVFCDIIARREPGAIRYEDAEVLVFDNRLRWVPVMLLVVLKQHVTQEEMWSSGSIAKVGAVAIQMGRRLCPGGYRLLSNFGPDAMQSQEHGHLHVLGGAHLGTYA
jgi:histidine triad (HIT) family protein